MSLSLPLRTALLLTLTGVALAGCGGDDPADAGGQAYHPEASTTMSVARPPLTKAQFVKRANKICRRAWVAVRHNWARHASPQDERRDKNELFAEAVRLPLLSGIDFYIFDDIRELGAPAGEEEEIEAIIEPFQIAVELGWKERWQAHSVAEVVPHFETYNARARNYGLGDCLVTTEHLRLPKLDS